MFSEQMERQEEDALINSSGTEISRNINRLAERRSDIFGVGAQGAEQTVIGQKLGEKERQGPPRPDPRNIWDGQVSSFEGFGAHLKSTFNVRFLAIHHRRHNSFCTTTSSSRTYGRCRRFFNATSGFCPNASARSSIGHCFCSRSLDFDHWRWHFVVGSLR